MSLHHPRNHQTAATVNSMERSRADLSPAEEPAPDLQKPDLATSTDAGSAPGRWRSVRMARGSSTPMQGGGSPSIHHGDEVATSAGASAASADRAPSRSSRGSAGFATTGLNGRVTQAEVDLLEDGLNQTLAAIEQRIADEVFAETLPLVGDQFRTAWINNDAAFRYVTALRTAAVGGLATLTGNADYSVSEVVTPITSRLATAGFNTRVVVATTVGDQVQLAFTTAETYSNGTVPLAQDFGIPNLDLHLSNSPNGKTSTSWTFNFTAGADAGGFYLQTGGSLLSLGTTTTISGLDTPGRFNQLPYSILNNGSNPTSIPANFAISLKDPGSDGKIRINELSGSPDLLDATVTGSTKLSLALISAIDPGQMLPKLGTDLSVIWAFSSAEVDPDDNNESFGNQPLLNLDNNQVNLESFFNSFAVRALSTIGDTTAPLQEVIDKLTYPIPLLSDLGSDDVTILDLFDVDPETVDAIGGLARILDLANLTTSFSGNGAVKIDLGSQTLVGGDLRTDSLNAFTLGLTRVVSSNRDADLLSFMSAAEGVNGLDFPILEDGTVVANLMLGRDATLFTYRTGEIGFEEQLGPLFFPVLGPIGITLGGQIGMKTEFGFGYDTRGIYDYYNGGGIDQSLLLNGFFAMGLDEDGGPLTGIELSFGVTAGVEANFGIASAGVEGDLTATVGFYLNDLLGDELGRVRGNTILTTPWDDLFYSAGTLSAGLRAYVEFGISPFSVGYDWESPRVVILNYDSRDTEVPVLGSPSGSTLLLNIGTRSGFRVHGNLDDRAEEFEVGAGIQGVLVGYVGAENTFSESINLISANAGLRGDVIEVQPDVNIPVDFHGGEGRDLLSGGAAADVIHGDDGPDRLKGRGGSDLLYGGNDNDELLGGQGSDTLDGGPGEDTASWSDALARVTINLLTGTFGGEAAFDTLISIERYRGSPFADVIDGDNNSNGLLDGDGGDDVIRGNGGDDQLEGGGGDDTMDGGEGNDLLKGGSGADTMEGGPGIDTLSYLSPGFPGLPPGAELEPVTVNLETGLGSQGEADGDVFSGFEVLIGSGVPQGVDSPFFSGDHLTGSDNPETINGMSGNDVIHGGGGPDIIYGDYSEGITSILEGFDADKLYGDAGNDMIYGQNDNDLLDGGAGNDALDGGEGDDDLDGGPDADTLAGGAGNDHLHTTDLASADFLSGDEDYDRLSADYSDKVDPFTFTVGVTNNFSFPDGDGIQDIETLGVLKAGNGNDVIRLASSIEAEFYNKSIDVGPGDDLVFSDWRGYYPAGNGTQQTADQLHGGDGVDTLSFEQSIGGVDANLGSGALGGSAAGMTMSGFENLIGTRYIDSLTGDGGDNILDPVATLPNLDGPGRNDYVVGSGGVDTLRVDFSTLAEANAVGVSMTPNAVSGYEAITLGSIYSPANVSALLYYLSVERFEITGSQAKDRLYSDGGNYQDRFIGLGGDDYINAWAGDDYIDGGEGNDTLEAGTGNDTVLGGAGNDVISFDYFVNNTPAFGTDICDAGPGDDVVNDIRYATSYSDTTYADVTTIFRFDGGDGIDTLSADFGNLTFPFVFNEHQPTNLEFPGGAYIRNFEKLGSIITGDGDDVLILAGRSTNYVVMRGGNDVLNPGLGIDRVNGGAGVDTIILDYSVGDDPDVTGVTLNGSNWHQRRRISDNALLDEVVIAAIEKMQFYGSSKDDSVIGLPGGNLLYGAVGADTLRGHNGSDLLDGGPGADTMLGGAGNDSYLVEDPGDIVTEGTSQGLDVVWSSISYTLPANVELLNLTGSAIFGTGNSITNIITGNSRDNVLRGEGGTDTLNGGGGPREIDTLNGGANADIFFLGDGSVRFYDDGSPDGPGLDGYAVIEDFTPSQSDKLRLTGSTSSYFLGTSPVAGISGIALYHDSNGSAALEPGTDELIAILQSPETLTVANTLATAIFPPAVLPATFGLVASPESVILDNGSGPSLAIRFSIFEPMPAGVLLEIQTSTDLGISDPWLTIASKNGNAAWTGPAAITASAPSGGRTTVTVSALQPTAGRPRNFMRLRWSAP